MKNQFSYKRSNGITVLSASMSDFRYKTHAHDEYALGVTLRGVQQYNLGGTLQSSCKDGIMLFNPEQPHDGMALDASGIDYVMLYIEPDHFKQLLETKKAPSFSSPIIYDPKLERKLLNIANVVLTQKDKLVCEEALSSLAEYFNPSIFEPPRKDGVLVRKAKEMIRCDVEAVKLEEICTELDISKYQFIRMFKTDTGITPYQYFLSFKIETAKQIIEKTHDIYSAVEGCNYVDLTHLNKHFKQTYGITAYHYLQSIVK
ncbi:MAG: AraC family ligand binding domain-containing protein [Pleomorphochaeta sp.]